MRLVIATTHRRLVGGIETYLRALLPELAKRGFELAILYEFSALGDGPTVEDGVPGIPVIDAQAIGDAAAVEQVRAFRPDVLFQQGLARVPLEEALLGLAPSVLFAHVYHGGCISGWKRFGVPDVRPCERAFGPACLGLYLPRRCGGLSPRSMWREYAFQARRRALMSRYRGVVVASRRMRREYAGAVLPEDRVTLAPYFPTSMVPDEAPPAPRPPTGRVMMLGRLAPLKGCGLLVPAMANASRTLGQRLELVLVGDGPERARMEELGRKLDVPITSHGWVWDARREELMRGADALAVPSVWPEPFGIVGVEACCVGLPSVGFEVGGIPDWLEPGVSGELAPADPPTVKGLTAALVRALADRDHLQRLREGAWLASQRFTPANHLHALIGVLQAAAGSASPDAARSPRIP